MRLLVAPSMIKHTSLTSAGWIPCLMGRLFRLLLRPPLVKRRKLERRRNRRLPELLCRGIRGILRAPAEAYNDPVNKSQRLPLDRCTSRARFRLGCFPEGTRARLEIRYRLRPSARFHGFGDRRILEHGLQGIELLGKALGVVCGYRIARDECIYLLNGLGLAITEELAPPGRQNGERPQSHGLPITHRRRMCCRVDFFARTLGFTPHTRLDERIARFSSAASSGANP